MSIGYNEIIIKFVSLYLRKSRGESIADLIKHKTVLEELCKRKGWVYVIYEEIETGESLYYRPVMQQMLKDIEDNTYDAVICIDLDRLGRGTLGEWDHIKQIFQKTSTYIVTPSSLYNLADDNDEFAVDLQTVFARREYKKISKRLSMGKKVGAKLGAWVNGTPPLPYVYEEWFDPDTHMRYYNKKGLVVDRTKLNIYRYMVDGFLKDKKSLNEIAWELNKMDMRTNRGCRWHNETIRRLLVDETHLGKIIYNKTKGDGHKDKINKQKPVRLPKDQWTIIENRHEAVKTQDEHDKILMRLSDNKLYNFYRTHSATKLKGLVKCGCCGRTLSLEHRQNGYRVKKCWYTDPFGQKCQNIGGNAEYIIDAIDIQLDEYEEEITKALNKNESVSTDEIQKNIKAIMTKISKKDAALKRARVAYDEGVDTLDEYRSAKDRINKDIEVLENQLDMENLKLQKATSMTNHEKLHYIKEFKEKRDSGKLSEPELNDLYKTIISSIVWTRTTDKIDIVVNFL